MTAYRVGGETYSEYPAHLPTLDGVELVTEPLPGWSEDAASARTFDALPAAARRGRMTGGSPLGRPWTSSSQVAGGTAGVAAGCRLNLRFTNHFASMCLVTVVAVIRASRLPR